MEVQVKQLHTSSELPCPITPPAKAVPRPYEHLAFSIFFTVHVVFFVNAKTSVPDAPPEDVPPCLTGEGCALPLLRTSERGLSMIAPR